MGKGYQYIGGKVQQANRSFAYNSCPKTASTNAV